MRYSTSQLRAREKAREIADRIRRETTFTLQRFNEAGEHEGLYGLYRARVLTHLRAVPARDIDQIADLFDDSSRYHQMRHIRVTLALALTFDQDRDSFTRERAVLVILGEMINALLIRVARRDAKKAAKTLKRTTRL